MADMLPVNFAIPSENVVASYNYQDIIDGSGVANFYLFIAQTSNSSASNSYAYGLTNDNSVMVHDNQLAQMTPAQNPADVTFTFSASPFNSPRDLNGDVIFTLPFFAVDGDNDTTFSGDIKAQLYHYDGSTETQIGADVCERLTAPTSGAIQWMNFTGKITASNKHFKKGEILRFKVTFSSDSVLDEGASYCGIACDPSGNYDPDDVTVSSVAVVRAPFKIYT